MPGVSVFLDVFPPPFIGGAEKSSLQILQILQEADFDIHVHALYSHGKKNQYRVKIHRIINIYNPFKSTRIPKLAKYIWHFMNLLNLFEILRSMKLLLQDRSNLVVTQNIDTWSFAPLIAARLLKIRTIHFVRDFGAICPTRTMWSQNRSCILPCKKCQCRLIASRIFIKPDVVIFNSHFTKNQYSRQNLFLSSKKFVFYPLIDREDVIILTQNNRKPPREWTPGFIGRISQEKGVEDFLRVCTETNSNGVVAGTGDLQYVNSLKNEFPNVKFLGQVSFTEFLNQVSVVVVPSLWNEPFGRIVVESCLGGVPIIVSKRGGLIESSKVFKHNNEVYFFEGRDELLSCLSRFKSAPDIQKSSFDVKSSYEKFRESETTKFRRILNEALL